MNECGIFKAGDSVDFRGVKDWDRDSGTVVDPEPNRDGRILVRWRSGAESWAKLSCLRPSEGEKHG